jgi:hypothetical protein
VTLRTTLRLRLELRFARLFVDLRFVAAKLTADYADCDKFGKAKFSIPGSMGFGRLPS